MRTHSLIHPLAVASAIVALTFGNLSAAEKPPQVGEKAPEFELTSVTGEKVKLSETLKTGPTVLVVLRGYPGYQCPVCSRQVGELMGKSKAIRDAGGTVLFVYPGNGSDLGAKADEFLGDRKLPEGYHLLLDPAYTFTNRYHLRWDAVRETAYPSTFVIATDGTVKYAVVSETHGGRAKTADVLKALEAAAKK